MKLWKQALLAVAIFMVIAVAAFWATNAYSQDLTVRYGWTQPDSTVATLHVPSIPLADGSLSVYEVYRAAAGDTIVVAMVEAPFAIGDQVYCDIPFELNVPTSVAERVMDTRGQWSIMSEWSSPLTVMPGPPQAGGQPIPDIVNSQ